jgi:hypothetical protein
VGTLSQWKHNKYTHTHCHTLSYKYDFYTSYENIKTKYVLASQKGE